MKLCPSETNLHLNKALVSVWETQMIRCLSQMKAAAVLGDLSVVVGVSE